MTDFTPQDITTRPESDIEEDRQFLRRLFCSLDQVQTLMQFGDQAELLIDMQLQAREQQYHALYPDGSFELILLRGEPIGRLAIDRSDSPWTLIDIAIMPEFRGHAVGSSLIRELLQSACDVKIDVRASVHADNLHARRLWLNLGFQVVEERLDYWSLLYSPAKT